jgi:diguanylate cyclase (GGDEF)-like protein
MVDAELEFAGSVRIEEELLDMAFLEDDLIPTSASVSTYNSNAASTANFCIGDIFESDPLFTEPLLVGYDEIERLLELEPEYNETHFENGGGGFMDIHKSAWRGEPDGSFLALPSRARGAAEKRLGDGARGALFPPIGNIAKPGRTFAPDKSVEVIDEVLKLDRTITEFTVVAENAPSGFMTRAMFSELLGGRYGYWLNSKRKIGEVECGSFLKVDSSTPIDKATKLAMQRSQEALYNPIVVHDEAGYYGIVTIKDLLEAYTKIEVEVAINSNPLTKLPGNMVIESEIMKRLFGEAPYCIIYVDVDNFKAYNDAYGFENGDRILKFVAETITRSATRGEFVGHIGGDDLIIICDYHDGEEVCRGIIDNFSAGINSFYRDVDVENGFIVSTNRHGVVDSFPIASLSIAGISNRSAGYKDIDVFSKTIAHLKKKCKKQKGSYYEIL